MRTDNPWSKDDRMKPRTMNFSRDWKKLSDRRSATMRVHRGDRELAPDEMVDVVSPKKKFRARALPEGNWKSRDLPFSFLEKLYGAPAQALQSPADTERMICKGFSAVRPRLSARAPTALTPSSRSGLDGGGCHLDRVRRLEQRFHQLDGLKGDAAVRVREDRDGLADLARI